MDDSSTARSNRPKLLDQSVHLTHVFSESLEGRQSSLASAALKISCILCFPAWFIMPAHSSYSGVLSSVAALLILCASSYISSRLVVKHALRKETSILETVHRLLGSSWRTLYLLLGMFHYLLIGGIFFLLVS